MDLVTVIMPYYKKINTVNETIVSVLNQSYKNFELIIVYDDGDKNDLIYIKEITKKHKNINIVVNVNNLGAGYSRNKALNTSKGKFIAFIDADDTWDKKKLELQISFMKKNNYKITHTNYEIVDEIGNFLNYRKAKNYISFESLLKSCDIGLSTVIIEKKLFKNNLKFPNLKTKEDFVLWLKILKKNYAIIALNLYLTKWKKTKNSLSSSIFQKLKDGFKVYNYYMKFNIFKSIYLLFCLSINYLKK